MAVATHVCGIRLHYISLKYTEKLDCPVDFAIFSRQHLKWFTNLLSD